MNNLSIIQEREMLQKWLSNIQTRVMMIGQEIDLLVQSLQLIKDFIQGEKYEL